MPLTPRDIPSIDALRRAPGAAALELRHGRDNAVDALRAVAADLRDLLVSNPDAWLGEGVDSTEALTEELLRRADAELSARSAPSLRPVINATGVIVHTNLGRAPLSEGALAHVANVARGYCNLEYDLDEGGRGRRDVHAEALLRRVTGADAALVVNNNAAATMLVLAALAAGREVIVSRGELVEIGGGFRVPDILRQSGATLREVGTTNRTRVADYAAAISERTALVLRVHPSNFRMEGFTERPDAASLAALARRFSIPVVEDLGSGNLSPDRMPHAGPLAGEPTVQESLRAGLDVVCISGDKLLGGPQAGIVLGRAPLLGVVRSHPLMRALRVDKLTYAALEATLVEHASGRAATTVPVARMLRSTPDEIEARAAAIRQTLASSSRLRTWLEDGFSTVGGGSAPGSRLPTRLLVLEVEGAGADALATRLRAGTPPVVARIENEHLVVDLRTVLPSEDAALASALAAVVPTRHAR